MGKEEHPQIVDLYEKPIFAPPTQKGRKTSKVTKGRGPATRVEISFKDISVTVKNRGQQKKTLLDKVSGFIPAGEVLMVLGSSGCGKSKFCFCSLLFHFFPLNNLTLELRSLALQR